MEVKASDETKAKIESAGINLKSLKEGESSVSKSSVVAAINNIDGLRAGYNEADKSISVKQVLKG